MYLRLAISIIAAAAMLPVADADDSAAQHPAARQATYQEDLIVVPPAALRQDASKQVTVPADIWKGWQYPETVSLVVSPTPASLDQALVMRVSGLKPGEPITLQAQIKDIRGITWPSAPTFLADPTGVVDAARLAPEYGSYAGIQPMGLVWSMSPVGVKDPTGTLFWLPNPALDMQVEALADGHVLADSHVTRYVYQDAEVTKTTVTEDGLSGELFMPKSPGPHSGIIVLGGSEGGLHPAAEEAALLASHGYAALGLAYFQGYSAGDPAVAKLPASLVKIPLEYFRTAASWLRDQHAVDSGHIAIMGWSKGAEAALLAAATWPGDFQAVVATMPSSVVWAGLGPADADSSWTLAGTPLPFVNPGDPADPEMKDGLAFTSMYQAGLKDAVAVAKAAIPVEKIAAPIMLVSAGDDAVWPSRFMTQQLMQRLQAHRHPYADLSLCYSDAGHAVLPPYQATGANGVTTPLGKILFGGNPIAYAYADEDYWHALLGFLHGALSAKTGPLRAPGS